MTNDDNLERLERHVGHILRNGVRLSSTALVIGLALLAVRQDSLAGIAMTAGLLVLTAIPVTRIVTSLVDALRRRDKLLTLATTVELSVLALLFLMRSR